MQEAGEEDDGAAHQEDQALLRRNRLISQNYQGLGNGVRQPLLVTLSVQYDLRRDLVI